MTSPIVICILIFAAIYCAMLFWMLVIFAKNAKAPLSCGEGLGERSVALVIACRNEEENISNIINSIQKLNYPEQFLQIIFVDDNSTDATCLLIEQHLKKVKFKTQLLKVNNKKPSKKFAIDFAIKNTEAEIIITTDADCQLPADLILHHTKILCEENIVASLAYVAVENNNDSFLNNFQIFEMQALQVFTFCFANAGNPIMCNGANFAYKRQAYLNVNGFEGNMQINSGDDVFLLHKFNAKFQKGVKYCLNSNSIVITKPLVDFKAFLSQRLRWASKSAYYTDKTTKMVGFAVLFGNLSMVFLYIFSFFSINLAQVLVGYFVLKLILEFLLLQKVYRIENRNMNLKWFLPFAIIYPVYSVVMALVAPMSKVVWKGVPIK